MSNQSKEYHSICHYARYSQYIRNKGYQGMQNTRGAKEFSLQYLARVVRVYVYIYIYIIYMYIYINIYTYNVYIYIYVTITRLLKICVISNNILNEIRCIIENANDVLRHRLSTPFDSPDFLRMASDAYAGPGWSTTRHDGDRSLHV